MDLPGVHVVGRLSSQFNSGRQSPLLEVCFTDFFSFKEKFTVCAGSCKSQAFLEVRSLGRFPQTALCPQAGGAEEGGASQAKASPFPAVSGRCVVASHVSLRKKQWEYLFLGSGEA